MINATVLLLLIALLAGCNPVETELSTSSSAFPSNGGSSGSSSNNRAYAITTNPAVQLGSGRTPVAGMNLKPYISSTVYTVDPSYYVDSVYRLYGDCSFSSFAARTSTSQSYDDCFGVTKTDGSYRGYEAGGFYFDVYDDEFYEVNTFILSNISFSKYASVISRLGSIASSGNNSEGVGFTFPPSYPAFPTFLRTESQNSISQSINEDDETVTVFEHSETPQQLKINPLCDYANNGFYDPVNHRICLGFLSSFQGVVLSQDPSIVYHEIGHAFIDSMYNSRNFALKRYNGNLWVEMMNAALDADGEDLDGDGVPDPSNDQLAEYESAKLTEITTSLGSLAYDEAGAINEAIADYFAYSITGRKHIGEWGLGFIKADRPLTESDDVHSNYVKSSQLSYPDYINYNVYDPNNPTEAIHYTGQIATHFFTAFDGMLTSYCSMSPDTARLSTLSLIADTLANIGDLTARGSDYNDDGYDPETAISSQDEMGQPLAYLNNLNPENAVLFTLVVNPPNFRRFFQVFSRSVLHFIVNGSCKNSITKDQYEQLLDSYGLLLFRTYNDNLNNLDMEFSLLEQGDTNLGGEMSTNRENDGLELLNKVNEINRQKSILISKEQLSLPSITDNRPQAYVFDNRSDIEKVMIGMTYAGQAASISSGIAGYEYNNGNGYVSPGEIVGISLNLINNSNTTAAGVHILANDWDHLKLVTDEETEEVSVKPCQINGWPLESENGAVDLDPSDPQPGDCNYASRDNGKGEDPTDYAAPICLIQVRDNNETKWVTQEEYRDRNNHFPWNCLNNDSYFSSGYYDPESGEECPAEETDGCIYQSSYSQNNECYLRVLKPTQHAFFSNLKPQKTLLESLAQSDGSEVALNASSAVFFEASKYIPPGTTFMCRFRVRMNNCSDCFDDPDYEYDDYQDYEFNGHKPFKVINYKFTVID